MNERYHQFYGMGCEHEFFFRDKESINNIELMCIVFYREDNIDSGDGDGYGIDGNGLGCGYERINF